MGILSTFRFAFQNLFFTPVLYGVIASLAVFSTTWEKGDRIKDSFTDKFRGQEDTFDFIVVGAGSAGAVVAARLSEYHSVLLLEAGGEPHPFQAIPGLSIFIPNHLSVDWMHRTVTQSRAFLGSPEQRASLSQGRGLGGSGNLNYLIHLRGSPRDYDNWATITGDPTWSYEGVLPYFTRSEKYVGPSIDGTAHGTDGELQIGIPDYTGMAQEFIWAGQELGYQHTDLNTHFDEGFDSIYYPAKKGVRQATYRAFIQPIRNRPNLVIRKFAHVNRLVYREGTNEVHGVQYDRHLHSRYAFANKEVILSAGSIQTPKILQLSGIGPSSVLQNCGIPIRVDLPVGQNLQDHVSVLLGPFFINQPRSLLIDRDVTVKSFLYFTADGTGALSTSGFQATSLLASSFAKARGEGNWPDLQLSLFGLGPHRLIASDLSHAFGLRDDYLSKYFYSAVQDEHDGFFILVTVARPAARGDVAVSHSNDPYRRPVIDPRYLDSPGDLDYQVMLEGIKSSLILVENTTAFQNLDAKFTSDPYPPCAALYFRSDEYWECYIRQMTVTLADVCGTCAMGAPGAQTAVVDPQLRIQGMHRVRIVDASVMPTIVGGNLQAAAIMIAEKASAMILDTWKESIGNFDPGQQPLNLDDPDGFNGVFHDGATLVSQQQGPSEHVDGYDSLREFFGTPQNYEHLIKQSKPYPTSTPTPNKGVSYSYSTTHPTPTVTSAVTGGYSSSYPTSPTPHTYVQSSTFGTTPAPIFSSSIATSSTPTRGGKSFNVDINVPNGFEIVEIEPIPLVSTTTVTSNVPIAVSSTAATPTRGPTKVIKIRRRRPKRPPGVAVHPRASFGVRPRKRKIQPSFISPANLTLENQRIYYKLIHSDNKRPTFTPQTPVIYDYDVEQPEQFRSQRDDEIFVKMKQPDENSQISAPVLSESVYSPSTTASPSTTTRRERIADSTTKIPFWTRSHVRPTRDTFTTTNLPVNIQSSTLSTTISPIDASLRNSSAVADSTTLQPAQLQENVQETVPSSTTVEPESFGETQVTTNSSRRLNNRRFQPKKVNTFKKAKYLQKLRLGYRAQVELQSKKAIKLSVPITESESMMRTMNRADDLEMSASSYYGNPFLSPRPPQIVETYVPLDMDPVPQINPVIGSYTQIEDF